MPNWCDNRLVLHGPVDEVKAIWDKAQSSPGGALLEAIAPIKEWDYHRAIERWGTKWDVSTENLEFVDEGDGMAVIRGQFDSAWSPPIAAFRNLPDTIMVCIYYWEPGMGFVGLWDSHDGEEFYDYSEFNDYKTLIDTIPADIIEEFNLVEHINELNEDEVTFH